ncbi:MAG: hypothetical protein HKL84_02680 [Acidimicrobiaceae bacterium]|nr:hypothetical protein [Acidimicrobiaceae bacterium]
MLGVKAEEAGCTVVSVNPLNTILTCSRCERVRGSNSISYSVFKRLVREYTKHADESVAHNSLRAGLARLAD